MKKKILTRHITDKKRLLQKEDHITRPPRLEGVVKEAMMQPIRKKKRHAPKKTPL
jgi:hypothetical protein